MSLFANPKLLFAFLILSVASLPPAMADKPEWAGNKHEKSWDKGEHRGYEKGKPYFTDQHRVVVSRYYSNTYRSGRCPPGLAKKHNGCLPPGQAKKWQLYQPLPPEVFYFSVPRSVVVEIGPPPPGHRYVRVGADILLIAIGTRMVVDAMTDVIR